MATARYAHAASTLPDGTVLVAGGATALVHDGIVAQTATAEIFNEATGLFTPASEMTIGRAFMASAPLNDGRVIFLGGEAASDSILIGATSDIEFYDPTARSFSSAPTALSARGTAQGSLLPDGSILFAGGFRIGTGFMASAMTFRPYASDSSTVGDLQAPRYDYATTILTNGDPILLGGYDNNSTLSSSERYVVSASAFKPTAKMTTVRTDATATRLSDGRILVAGGRDIEGPPASSVWATAEVYDEGHDTFRAVGSMTEPRFGHGATLLPNGKVLVAGGFSSDGITWVTRAEVFDPITERFSPAGSPTAPGLTGMIAIDSSSALIKGSNSAELFDTASNHTYPMNVSISGGGNLQALPRGGILACGTGYCANFDTATRSFSSPFDDSKEGNANGHAPRTGGGDMFLTYTAEWNNGSRAELVYDAPARALRPVILSAPTTIGVQRSFSLGCGSITAAGTRVNSTTFGN